MDKLVAMKSFVRIVDTGSLTAAASSLDTSLPTVVRTLARLERDLGVSLLKRTTRRIHLTEEGAQYLERCRNILLAIQEAEEKAVTTRTALRGRLTVTASGMFGRRYVAPVVSEFLQRHPSITADLLLVDRVVNLIEEGIDVAVRIAKLKDSSLVAIHVGRVRRVVCASADYLRRHGTPRVPSDIRKHQCVRNMSVTPRSDEWRLRWRNRTTSIPIQSVMACNDVDGALTACIRGLGLGMFLSYQVAPYIRTGKLQYVLERFEDDPLPVQVVYPSSKLLSAKVRAFIDYCVEELRSAKFD